MMGMAPDELREVQLFVDNLDKHINNEHLVLECESWNFILYMVRSKG